MKQDTNAQNNIIEKFDDTKMMITKPINTEIIREDMCITKPINTAILSEIHINYYVNQCQNNK